MSPFLLHTVKKDSKSNQLTFKLTSEMKGIHDKLYNKNPTEDQTLIYKLNGINADIK